MSNESKKGDWLLGPIQHLSDADKLAFELLFKQFPLRPIRGAEQNRRAMALADELLARRLELSAVERDYLEVLGHLIRKFESEAYAEDELDVRPNELIRSLIEIQGLKQADLAKELGITPSRLSEYLNGKRRASKVLAKKLATRFAVSLDVLLADAEPDNSESPTIQEFDDDMRSSSAEIVLWNRAEQGYLAIKAAADAAGVPFDAYVKVVAYNAACPNSEPSGLKSEFHSRSQYSMVTTVCDTLREQWLGSKHLPPTRANGSLWIGEPKTNDDSMVERALTYFLGPSHTVTCVVSDIEPTDSPRPFSGIATPFLRKPEE